MIQHCFEEEEEHFINSWGNLQMFLVLVSRITTSAILKNSDRWNVCLHPINLYWHSDRKIWKWMWDISWHNGWFIPFGECLTSLKKICRSKSQSSWCYTSSFANKTDNLKSNKILNHRFLLQRSVRPLRKRTNFGVYGCYRGVIGGAKGSSCSGARKKITHAGEKKKKKRFFLKMFNLCVCCWD